MNEPTRSYPIRLEARLEEPGRWSWLYKWFLAIPHLIILVFLWIAFVVSTVVAWFSIALTGRYPKSLFQFNVGVMRWAWRVQFYAFVLGTDRYPPFSLRSDPTYPADLDVVHRDRLSRGLVWVKSWLLAIPHLLVAGLFMGGGLHPGGGVTGVLALVAAVVLATGQPYPPTIFDFLIGLHRWVWRVIGYTALMYDEYPPFRVDQGPTEPDGDVVAVVGPLN